MSVVYPFVPLILNDTANLNRTVLELETNYNGGNNDAGTLRIISTEPSLTSAPEIILQRKATHATGPLAGQGPAIQFVTNNSAEVPVASYIDSGWESGTTGAEYTTIECAVLANGGPEAVEIGWTGATATSPSFYPQDATWKLGFPGTPWAHAYLTNAIMQAISANAVFKSANYTMDSGATPDFGVLADATAGAITITLPTAPVNGRIVAVTKNDNSGHNVTVAAGVGDTIELPSPLTAVLSTQYKSLHLYYLGNGTNLWLYLGGS